MNKINKRSNVVGEKCASVGGRIDYGQVLADCGFGYNKALGQNFVFDTNLLNAIAVDSGVCKSDTVLEIGVGAGSMTNVLAKLANKVVGFEIDSRLRSVHQLTLQCDNIEIFYRDFLKVSESEIVKFGEYKVVANLPYYITTPIVFKLLESANPPSSITIMVQKEVADRLIASPNTSQYGVLSVTVALHCKVRLLRNVSKAAFVPQPSVDSAVVHLTKNVDNTLDIARITKLIKVAFGNRRKMLVNNLMQHFNFTKVYLLQALDTVGISHTARGESLSVEQFVALSDALKSD